MSHTYYSQVDHSNTLKRVIVILTGSVTFYFQVSHAYYSKVVIVIIANIPENEYITIRFLRSNYDSINGQRNVVKVSG